MIDSTRRRLVVLPSTVLLPGGLLPAALVPVSLTGCSGTGLRFAGWAQAREAVRELMLKPQDVQGNPWNLSQVLQHLAQSIEYSLRGFPALKAGWFRATLGSAAFAVFDARGEMSHSLDEPIPGAPTLDGLLALKSSIDRLLAAMDAFEAHAGPLQPHFAYGELSKPQYQRAHLMHIANHWQQFQPATAIA